MSEPIISKFAEKLERVNAAHFYLFAFFLLSIGFGLDLWFLGDWFQRSGAVVAGIIAFCYFNDLRASEAWWRYLGNRRLDEKHEAEEPIREAAAEAKLLKMRGADKTALKVKQEAFLETRPDVKRISDEYNKKWLRARSAVRAEGRCIAIGTFVWAFGDIPPALLRCGETSCFS